MEGRKLSEGAARKQDERVMYVKERAVLEVGQSDESVELQEGPC